MKYEYLCNTCGNTYQTTHFDTICANCSSPITRRVLIGLDTIVHQTGKRDTNPKTRFGATKPPLALIPATALIHCAMAFKDGASKYGPYNWREKAVSAMTYLNAIDRHSKQFLDGEDYDTDSLVHHLGHTMACCAIILDAIAVDNLIDDRPPKAPTADLIRRFTTKMEAAND